MSTVKPYFRPFDECEPYTQKDAAGLSFNWALPKGVIPGLQMGLVTAEGPTHKFAATHAEWDQVYLVFKGSGYIYLNDKQIRIDRPGIIVIPNGTKHSIEVDDGQVMQYIFVHKYLEPVND